MQPQMKHRIRLHEPSPVLPTDALGWPSSFSRMFKKVDNTQHLYSELEKFNGNAVGILVYIGKLLGYPVDIARIYHDSKDAATLLYLHATNIQTLLLEYGRGGKSQQKLTPDRKSVV